MGILPEDKLESQDFLTSSQADNLQDFPLCGSHAQKTKQALPDFIAWHLCIAWLTCKLILPFLPPSPSKAAPCADIPLQLHGKETLAAATEILCLIWRSRFPVPCINPVSGFSLLSQSLGLLLYIQLPLNTYHKSSAQLVVQLSAWRQQ